MNRPEVGEKTVSIVSVHICKECNSVIHDPFLCDWECKYDGDYLGGRPYLTAKYERTDKFLGDFQKV